MATKKLAPKKKATKTIIQKIGETASHLKEEIVSGKDYLVEVAGDAVESIKTSIHKITHTGKATKNQLELKAKKTIALPKKAVKKAIKKVAVKKFVPAKKVKKAVKRK